MVNQSRIVLTTALLTAAAVSQALVLIDGFTTDQSRLSLYNLGMVNNTVSGGAFLFAHRTQVLIQDFNTGVDVARNTAVIRTGVASYSSDWEVDGQFRINYSQQSNVGFNLSATPAFRLNFLYNDIAMPLTVHVTGFDTGTNSSLTATGVVTAPASATPFSVTVNSWNTAIPWHNVTDVKFHLNPAQAGDFQVDSVEAVPEPATLLVLGAGAAALMARRRRR